MKTRKLMLFAAFAVAVSVGCTGLEPYEVDAPEDLSQKIADYIAEKQASQQEGVTEITITVPIVGAEDNTQGWWSDGGFSQYFAVPPGKKLVLEFENYGSGVNNWNNWNLCVAKGERGADGYSEYFVIRSDWYGWGNADYNGSLIEFDYGGGEVNWDEFREKMQGAYVTMTLDHARAGAAYLEVHSVAADGFDIVEKYNQPVSATEDINLFLVADGSHFNVKKAYLVDSEIAEIPDEDAMSITVTGFPTSVEVGATSFEQMLEDNEIVGHVTFADKSVADVPASEISFNYSETFGQKIGTETVVYSYSKTKQGKYGPSVGGFLTIEVSNPIDAIEASVEAYLIGGARYVTLSPSSVKVMATYRDGSKAQLKTSQVQIEFTEGKTTWMCEPGVYEKVATVTYKTASGTELTVDAAMTVKASEQAPQTEMVGAQDFTNAWWTTFSRDWVVPAGTTQTVSMQVGSDNLGNWHSPCTILRKADMSEYAVVRQDNYGWGAGYEGNAALVLSSNWNWDTFMSAINGSKVSISVSNGGDGFASVRYYVVDGNGEEHFQYYDNILVEAGDLQFALVTEESYLIFD